MSPDNVEALIRQTLDRPSGSDLEAAARKQAEHDSGRRPLFEDATRRLAAVYEEKSLHHSITHLTFLPSGQEPTDRFSNREVWEQGPSGGVSGGESDELLRARNRHLIAGQATADQFTGITVPFAPFLVLTRTDAANAGLVAGLNQSQPNRAVGTAIGKERHDSPLWNMPGRAVGNDAIAQLAPKYTAPLHVQRDRIASARETPWPDAGFTKALIDTLTSNQVHSRGEIGGDERESLPDRFQGRGRDHGFRSPQIDYPGAQADRMITNDLTHDRLVSASAIGSVLGGFGDMFDHGDQRANPGSSHSTFDRGCVGKSDDVPSSNTVTSGAAQEAMAAAADELERLRSAVRRTIDELERARGSVQPPLPALPVNRGTFRIS